MTDTANTSPPPTVDQETASAVTRAWQARAVAIARNDASTASNAEIHLHRVVESVLIDLDVDGVLARRNLTAQIVTSLDAGLGAQTAILSALSRYEADRRARRHHFNCATRPKLEPLTPAVVAAAAGAWLTADESHALTISDWATLAGVRPELAHTTDGTATPTTLGAAVQCLVLGVPVDTLHALAEGPA